MASFSFLLIIFISFITSSSPSLSLSSSHKKLESSNVISASPALLPDPLSSPSPNLSPDITPQFPTPGGSNLSPSDGPSSSMPTIPSNPSPPNPDEMITSKPNMAVSPSGSMLPTSTASRNLIGTGFLGLAMAAWLLLLLLQLFGQVKV